MVPNHVLYANPQVLGFEKSQRISSTQCPKLLEHVILSWNTINNLFEHPGSSTSDFFFVTHGFVIFVMHICIQTLLEHGSCAMDYCNCWKGIWHLKDLVDALDAMIFFPILAVPRSCFLQWQAHKRRQDATPPAVAVPSDPRTPFHENTWNLGLEACEKIVKNIRKTRNIWKTYGKHMVEKKMEKKHCGEWARIRPKALTSIVSQRLAGLGHLSEGLRGWNDGETRPQKHGFQFWMMWGTPF